MSGLGVISKMPVQGIALQSAPPICAAARDLPVGLSSEELVTN
jgi:hypothetical protein